MPAVRTYTPVVVNSRIKDVGYDYEYAIEHSNADSGDRNGSCSSSRGSKKATGKTSKKAVEAADGTYRDRGGSKTSGKCG